MSDEEMEEFNINDEDLNRAFNPGARRANKMSKEEAMLGIWASKNFSDSEDDDEDQFSYKNQSRKFSTKKSSGISFVNSSSSKKINKEENLESEEDSNQNQQDGKISDEDEFNDYKSKIEEIEEATDSDDNMEELSAKDQYLLSQFTRGVKKPVQPKPVIAEKQSRPKFKENIPKAEIKEIGSWEKHTKGIGMKLLEKMGWQKGKGIGKEMQGRAVPVEATLRKGKGSVGAHGAEHKEIRRDFDEEDEDTETVKPHVSQWKKDKKNKKPQYSLRTPEELIEMSLKQPNKLKKAEELLELGMKTESIAVTNKIKIIDMTGKEQRVMHGYESISHMTKLSKLTVETDENKKKLFDVPELRHNINLNVNMTEEKILQYDKKFKHYEDMIVSLNYEKKRAEERINKRSKQTENYKSLLNAIEKCERKANQDNICLDELVESFKKLKEEYPEEFIIFNLSQVAIPLFTPILKKKMKQWRPFENCNLTDKNEIILDQDEFNQNSSSISFCLDLYKELENLLNNFNYDTKSMNQFHRLLWDTWMPAFRSVIAEIRVRDFSIECVDLLNKWSRILPGWILENILEQVILPKLSIEVDEWNPLTDTVPIHIWIHPWLPLLKERLDSTLFPTIRFKLAKALTSWHPSDESAKAILIPWRPPAFSTTNWDQFLLRNILPKLEHVLENELVINPSQQNLEPWNWVMAWIDLIPMANFVCLIEKSFFTKWLKVLSLWLNSSPNFKEVRDWYLGWKTLLGEKLGKHPNIQAKLKQAFSMMNLSLEGGQVSYTEIQNAPQTGPAESKPRAPATSMIINPSVATFKDLIERKASDRGIEFLLLPNRFKEGRPIYRLGNVNIYIDNKVVFYQQDGIWIPAQIDDIIQKAL